MAFRRCLWFIETDILFLYFAFVIFLSCFVYSNKASEIRKPRGVSISKASLYIPDKDFTCFDGSLTISFLQVNDDYCDCPDGSDEPGTAACPNGFFHCTNAGFRPLNIPSAFVNDGVCDCCDGADEYFGKISCQNTCHELGKAERMEQQKQAEISKMGYEAKLHSIKKGKQIKLDKKEKLKQLENDKKEAESIKIEKEKLKVQAEELEKLALEEYRKQKEKEEEMLKEEEQRAEEREALEMFNMLDSNQDRKIHFNELQVRQTFDQNRDGAITEEEAKFFLENADEVNWDMFLATAWPKMKPFFMMEKGLFKPPARNLTEQELIPEPGDGVGTVEDITDEYHKERQQLVDEAEIHQDHEDEEEEEEEEEEEGAEPPRDVDSTGMEQNEPQYDEETQKLVNAANEARSEFEEADRSVRDIQRQISQYQEYLEKDFGPEEEFAALEGECFEYTDREYIYKLCPFDRASQQPRSGESETKLGQWSRWAGPENDKYQIMLYEKGQSCWNGPQRSAHVKLKCGVENVITSVTEPNKCEYHFEFSTPSACKMVENFDERVHDEL